MVISPFYFEGTFLDYKQSRYVSNQDQLPDLLPRIKMGSLWNGPNSRFMGTVVSNSLPINENQ